MTEITLYNTLTREKAAFTPLDPENIRIYACGPTVYDRIHVGNARPIVVFDVLVRLLRHRFDKVTYVRNITDVDDKIVARAAERQIDIGGLCEIRSAASIRILRRLARCRPTMNRVPQNSSTA